MTLVIYIPFIPYNDNSEVLQQNKFIFFVELYQPADQHGCSWRSGHWPGEASLSSSHLRAVWSGRAVGG